MKSRLSIVLLMVLSFGCQEPASEENARLENARLELRKYAFSGCMHMKYPSFDSLMNDGSSAGYFELSDYNLFAFEKVDSLVQTLKGQRLASKHNKELGMMSCLNFYESEDLKSFINGLDDYLIVR